MARVPMVTRTMKSTVATIMTVDVVNQTTSNVEYTLPRTYKSDAEILKLAQSAFDSDTVKLVHVLDSHVEEKLYGMPETDFILAAQVIDKKRKTTDDTND